METTSSVIGVSTVRVLLCGDVMTGRGIDQVLPSPSAPELREFGTSSAREYVRLAEQASSPVPAPVDFGYVWGDLPGVLRDHPVSARIANLETAVTTSDDFWPDKGIHYRMHPGNAACLAAGGIDCCALANNHVLDFGASGLLETLATLDRVGVARAGAGATLEEASAPAILELPPGRRLLVVSIGSVTSGIPLDWAATADAPGVHLIEHVRNPVRAVAERLAGVRREGDLVIASVHWGPNWEWGVAPFQIELAHRLVDEAGVDVVHGHSSHHVKPIEVHRGKLVLYGCGDFLTDYEGIRGYEEFRGDVGVAYLPELDVASGCLRSLSLVPMRMRRMQLVRGTPEDAAWLQERLSGLGEPYGTSVVRDAGGCLSLRWLRDGPTA